MLKRQQLYSEFQTENLTKKKWHHQKQAEKLQRKPERHKRLSQRMMVRRRDVIAVRNHTQSTSSRSWNKSIQTLVFPQRPWASWTVSSMTFSNVLLLKPHVWLTTTNDQQSQVARSKLLFVYSYLVNWLSTPSQKVQKPSPNTHHPNKFTVYCRTAFIGFSKWSFSRPQNILHKEKNVFIGRNEISIIIIP